MKCLICYKPLNGSEKNYHPKCVVKIFGTKQMPAIELDEKKLSEYAKKILTKHNAITGVQPKLSFWLDENKKNIRFTIIDSKSNYIIKPQSENYKWLPENEDLCMHLASTFGMKTAVHCLMRLPSNALAYITKRFDRTSGKKLACEDLCQLTETLTENKYRGSYEKTGKTIQHYSAQSGLDALHFFELVVFSFVTGNADMHLKNFSMLEKDDATFCLSPAYDLVSTRLVIKNENEQMALTINGKKNKITKKDIDALAKSLMLNEKQIINCYQSYVKKNKQAIWLIQNSFLPQDQKENFQKIFTSRIKILNN